MITHLNNYFLLIVLFVVSKDPVYIIMLFLEKEQLCKENGTTCIVHSYDSTCSVITFLGSEVHRISSAGFVDILLIGFNCSLEQDY